MSIADHAKKYCVNPTKRCYLIGTNWVVGIDGKIAAKLKITENDTILEQQIVENGILMKVKKLENCYNTASENSERNT